MVWGLFLSWKILSYSHAIINFFPKFSSSAFLSLVFTFNCFINIA